MSGIYIHIPFCKQACHYCDFHFSTNTTGVQEMVDMICKEAEIRKNYLSTNSPVKTIYFGGGTPSLLSVLQLEQILETLSLYYHLDLEELTLEANPDDLQQVKLKELKALGIDRLSIGIQTFDENLLRFYNRAHNATESLNAIALARDAGFQKMSIDLIYGFQAANHDIWKKDLEIAIKQDPGHISSYCLTIEPKTALGKWTARGKYKPVSEDFAAEQFEILQESMEQGHYIQYEISNFGKENSFAIHNTNYWMGVPFLGLGPGAHSFDGKNRGSNVSNNTLYNNKLRIGQSVFDIDILSQRDLANEYILTSLRTLWGTDLTIVFQNFGFDLKAEKQHELDQFVLEGLLEMKDSKLILTKKGKLLADGIASALFIS